MEDWETWNNVGRKEGKQKFLEVKQEWNSFIVMRAREEGKTKKKKFNATRKTRVENGKYYFQKGRRKQRNGKKSQRGRRNGKMVKVYWKILEYSTVVQKDNTGSLEAQRG